MGDASGLWASCLQAYQQQGDLDELCASYRSAGAHAAIRESLLALRAAVLEVQQACGAEPAEAAAPLAPVASLMDVSLVLLRDGEPSSTSWERNPCSHP